MPQVPIQDGMHSSNSTVNTSLTKEDSLLTPKLILTTGKPTSEQRTPRNYLKSGPWSTWMSTSQSRRVISSQSTVCSTRDHSISKVLYPLVDILKTLQALQSSRLSTPKRDSHGRLTSTPSPSTPLSTRRFLQLKETVLDMLR